MLTEIKHFALLDGTLPGRIEIVLGDADCQEESKVWITAQFEFVGRDDDKLAVIEQEVLRSLQTLIDEGIRAVQSPPSSDA